MLTLSRARPVPCRHAKPCRARAQPGAMLSCKRHYSVRKGSRIESFRDILRAIGSELQRLNSRGEEAFGKKKVLQEMGDRSDGC